MMSFWDFQPRVLRRAVMEYLEAPTPKLCLFVDQVSFSSLPPFVVSQDHQHTYLRFVGDPHESPGERDGHHKRGATASDFLLSFGLLFT